MEAEKVETEKSLSIPELVRERFKADRPLAPDVDAYTEGLVASTLAEAARSDSEPLEVLDAVLEGVVKGVGGTGASLWLAARGAMLGVLRAGGAAGLDHRQALERVPATLVRLAEAGGGDFGAAAKGCVEGAIEGCPLTGLDEEEAASLAATAAYRAAATLRESAAIRIRHITTPAVRGIATRIRA